MSPSTAKKRDTSYSPMLPFTPRTVGGALRACSPKKPSRIFATYATIQFGCMWKATIKVRSTSINRWGFNAARDAPPGRHPRRFPLSKCQKRSPRSNPHRGVGRNKKISRAHLACCRTANSGFDPQRPPAARPPAACRAKPKTLPGLPGRNARRGIPTSGVHVATHPRVDAGCNPKRRFSYIVI